MSLTISAPSVIDARGLYTASTSITEDSAHEDVRIRAELYIDGEVKAILENPKGINDFDFRDILMSFIGPPQINHASDPVINQDDYTQHDTLWAVSVGSLTSFSSSTNQFSWNEAGTAAYTIKTSTPFTLTKGQVVAVTLFGTNSGAQSFDLALKTTGGTEHETKTAWQSVNGAGWFVVQTAGTYELQLSGTTASNVDIDFNIFIIDAGAENQLGDSETGLRPHIYYRVNFIEYYNLGANITEGVSEFTDTHCFVPFRLGSYASGDWNDNHWLMSGDKLPLSEAAYYADQGESMLGLPRHPGCGVVVGVTGYKVNIDFYYGLGSITYSAPYKTVMERVSAVIYLNIHYQDISAFNSADSYDFALTLSGGLTKYLEPIKIPFIDLNKPATLLFKFLGAWGWEHITVNGALKEESIIKRDEYENNRGMMIPYNVKRLRAYTINTGYTNKNYNRILQNMIASKKEIWMYNGDNYAKTNFPDWVPVSIQTTNVVIDDNKNLIDQDLQIVFYDFEDEILF